ncbi:MAG: right-handed parallel beta-helix repeat-containing protein [Myxococcota bacterium]
MKPMLESASPKSQRSRFLNASLLALTTASITLLASSAMAGDGRIEINQARALAGGISPTDGPGFPISLEGNQSYVLTSDLDTGGSSGLTASGALGTRDNITIDLNGFSLRGDPGSATTGINVTGGNIEIKNGTVSDFGGRGLLLQTSGRHIVRNLRVIENGQTGIQSNGSAVITDCFVQSNGGDGIQTGSSSYVARNRVSSSGVVGIDMSSSGLAEGNLIINGSTTEPALDMGSSANGFSSGYRNNLINGVNAGGTVTGGNDMGGNLCNGSTTCP